MTLLELIILAISLSFDTFAVSIGGGISLPEIKLREKAKVMAFFALFQGGFFFIGWLVGGRFADLISNWDHWIAFVILLYLGGKMVKESFKEEDSCEDSDGREILNSKKLSILAIATSIDAIAVGVSLAFARITFGQISIATVITIIITALAAYIGLTGGQKLGCKIGKRAELVGGIVLITIGIRILVEHL